MRGRFHQMALILMCLLLACSLGAGAEQAFPTLPLDTFQGGPAPRDEHYLSDTLYEDDTIRVEIFSGHAADTDYTYAHVRISDISQLRTAPAGLVNSPRATFKSTSTARGRLVARAVDAVVALNGDYYTKSDKCQVVMRMTHQVRNIARGNMDVLIIDKSGNFSAIKQCTKQDYQEYYARHQDEMYQVFCFGPVLVEDGVCVIAPDYRNGEVGAQNKTQRAAIAQLGELEYLLVTTAGPQSKGSKGMTIPELAQLVEELSLKFSPTGSSLAFNLDGGNSTTLVFKQQRKDGKEGLLYAKVNSPEIERFLSDIIYFSTLMPND